MTAASSEAGRASPSSSPAAAAASASSRSPLEPRQQRLGLRIAEAAVELEHARPVRGQHQPGEERADEGRPPPLELGEHRPADRLHEPGHLVVGEPRHRRVRAHAAGVRALVAVVDPLVVLGGGQAERRASVAEREDRDLLALEHLLDVERLPERLGGAQARVELRLGAADPDALARGEPVRLDDAGRARDGERSRGRHAGGVHDLLREALRALDRGGGGAGAEDGDAAAAQLVGEAGHERRLRPDDDEVDLELARERDERRGVLGPDGMALRERRDARVARGRVQLGERRAAGDRPGERVLPAPRSDDEDLHPAIVCDRLVEDRAASGAAAVAQRGTGSGGGSGLGQRELEAADERLELVGGRRELLSGRGDLLGGRRGLVRRGRHLLRGGRRLLCNRGDLTRWRRRSPRRAPSRPPPGRRSAGTPRAPSRRR